MSVSLVNPYDGAVCTVVESRGNYEYLVYFDLPSGGKSEVRVCSQHNLNVGDQFILNHLLIFEIIANDITIISRADSSSTEADAAADCNAASPGTDAEATAQQREHPASESSGA